MNELEDDVPMPPGYAEHARTVTRDGARMSDDELRTLSGSRTAFHVATLFYSALLVLGGSGIRHDEDWFGLVIMVGLLCAVFTAFILGTRVYPLPATFVVAVFAAIPFVNLVAWIMLNVRAMNVLRAAGLNVGIFGADLSALDGGRREMP